MQVIHLSTSDAVGGAARAAFRLHDGLRRRQVESEMLVLNQTVFRPDVRRFVPSRTLGDRLVRRARRFLFESSRTYRPLGSDSLEVFSSGQSPLGNEPFHSARDADIVNLHWSVGMFEYDALARPGRSVWTLHDMHPFTGGCHFDFGCGRFSAACGHCPQLGSHKERDASRRLWERRAAALARLSREQLTIVAPSRWLADDARQSSLLGRFPVEVIPYGLDTEVFRPRDRHIARGVLEIPEEARVILFIADSLVNRRKGFGLLLKALETLRDIPNLWLLSIGRGEDLGQLSLPHRRIPFIDDDRLLSVFYSAADLFVIPSIQDNLPNTVLEAMACGLPVVGFRVGGIPDMVRNGRNGHLAPVAETAAMSAAIREILTDPDRRSEMGAAARSIATAEFALDTQAARYEALYRACLGLSPASPPFAGPDLAPVDETQDPATSGKM